MQDEKTLKYSQESRNVDVHREGSVMDIHRDYIVFLSYGQELYRTWLQKNK
jgi:hypothetical protein